MSDWLELELADTLAPVRAPEALWMRVARPASVAPNRRGVRGGFAWVSAAAAALAVAGFAAVFALSTPGLAQLASAELAKGQAVDFASSDPHELARWLRKNSGCDVTIPSGTKVELLGACTLTRHGARIAKVSYRVDGRDAALLVTRAARFNAPERHGASTWKAHGQIYALAFSDPAQSHLACRLCHLD
jgi:hypothetical protein